MMRQIEPMRLRPAAFGVATLIAIFAAHGAAAQGCGPTRLKVTESVTLDLPPEAAWRIVGDFHDLSWASNTRASAGGGGNVPGAATRSTILADGSRLEESLYKFDAGAMSYAYHIDREDTVLLPVQNASVTLEVVPADGGRSTVRWRAAFYRFLAPNEPAPDMADANAAKAMSALGRASLDGLRTKSGAKT